MKTTGCLDSRCTRGLVGALGLGALCVTSVGCSSTCPDGDVGCLVESIQLFDLGTRGSASGDSTAYQQFEPNLSVVEDGPIEIVWVETSSIPESAATPSSGLAITNPLDPLRIDSPSSVEVVPLDYTDPFACRPMLCMRTNLRYFRSPCAPLQRDGYVVGRSYLGVRYESVPERTTEQLEVDIVPISRPGCGDVKETAVDGDGSLDDPLVLPTPDPTVLVVGEPSATTVVIVSEAEASDDGGGSGSGSQCSSWSAYCGSCGSVRACVTYSGGSCQGAWYETSSGQTFPCASDCDCTEAAGAMPYACGCVPQ